ncbi:MAG: diguanylate cyclase [Ignavibacteriae bacterium]|nr:diguanylate cyclase [Ignavibacteriota bacterium]
MIDARLLKTIRSWFNALSRSQELIVLAGVVLFIVGLFTASAVAFLLSGASLAYVAVTFRRPKSMGTSESGSDGMTGRLQPSFHNAEEDPEMTRNVFEDFQPEGKSYRVEVDENVGVPAEPMGVAESARGSQSKETEYTFQLSDFCDVDEEVFNREAGPKSEFSFLMKKVLTTVKDANFAHTVALFWINRDKNQMVLESFVSDSDKFTPHRRRELGTDIISQIAERGKPQILSRVNISGQLEMLGYYEDVEPVKAFAGVPVFYPKASGSTGEPVAVMVLDSLVEDAFGSETLALIGQFTKLISALIKSYTDKYDLLVDSEVLRSITRMREQMKLDFGLYNIVRALSEEASRLVTWDYISVVLYDENRKAWVVQYVMNRMNDPYVALTQEIDPQHSLVGTVLQASVPRIFDKFDPEGLPRFYKAERVDSAGAIMLLPINSVSRCYGLLVVESKDVKTYSESDAKLLLKLVETSSVGLEILSLSEVVNNYVSMDETTGVAARKYFMARMHEEVQRANDFSTDLALVMVSIDSMNDLLSRYGKDGFDFALQNVGRMMKSFIRPYDVIGRYDFNQFAVLLMQTTANEAFLWAEKLRKNIASNIINLDQKSFSVTISAGVCGATEDSSDVELLGNTTQVLRKAIETGGNLVRVF